MSREKAIQQLREALARISPTSTNPQSVIASQTIGARAEVIAKYGAMFAPENLDNLTADGFRSFLLSKNNHHWEGIHRQGGAITADMDRLKATLRLLLDETFPIDERLEKIRPHGEGMIAGLNRAVLTPILHVVYPEKYGVLNSKAEAGMKALGLWPDFPKGASFGKRYAIVNEVIRETASAVEVDLWTLDTLWWFASQKADGDGRVPDGDDLLPPEVVQGVFGLERYLHEFLVDNWQKLPFAKEWNLLEEDGEIVGSHYSTGEVGEIDLLAKHRHEKRWLVVELKRQQSSDATVGQILRYMGWVRRNLGKGDRITGWIISSEIDTKMQYALDGQRDIECLTYQVGFTLNPAPKLGDQQKC